MIYSFTIQGLAFECDLNDVDIVSGIREQFGNAIDDIVKNKEQYRVYTEQDKILELEQDNAALWYDLMEKDLLLAAHEQDIADLFYINIGGENTTVKDDE